jgi:aryl carrier-like protein
MANELEIDIIGEMEDLPYPQNLLTYGLDGHIRMFQMFNLPWKNKNLLA